MLKTLLDRLDDPEGFVVTVHDREGATWKDVGVLAADATGIVIDGPRLFPWSSVVYVRLGESE